MSSLEKQTSVILQYFSKRLKINCTDVSVELYEYLWDLLSLIDQNKQTELGIGEGGKHTQMQRQFIQCMFGTFFCQNAYNRFAKSEDFKLDAQTLINKGQ